MSLIFISDSTTVCNYTEDTFKMINNLHCLPLINIRVEIY